MSRDFTLTPDLLLRAYAVGIFPMAYSAEDERLAWFDPDPRGVLPLDAFHLPRRLARTIRNTPLRVAVDTDFAATIDGCAASAEGREKTWINHNIRDLCLTLHRRGYAHSVEVWDGADLVGGLYGIALKGAFFGESMFSRVRDASKIALVHLVARLRAGGFTLLDTQFVTNHLAGFGARDIPRVEYRSRLAAAMRRTGNFNAAGAAETLARLVESGA